MISSLDDLKKYMPSEKLNFFLHMVRAGDLAAELDDMRSYWQIYDIKVKYYESVGIKVKRYEKAIEDERWDQECLKRKLRQPISEQSQIQLTVNSEDKLWMELQQQGLKEE